MDEYVRKNHSHFAHNTGKSSRYTFSNFLNRLRIIFKKSSEQTTSGVLDVSLFHDGSLGTLVYDVKAQTCVGFGLLADENMHIALAAIGAEWDAMLSGECDACEKIIEISEKSFIRLKLKTVEEMGQVVRIEGLGLDCTDAVLLQAQRKDMENIARSLSQQTHAAEASSRAKARFLAEMSHDLRTPLNAIIGFAETMESELFGALGCQKYMDYTRDIRASGRQLLNYISVILEAAEREGEHGLPCNAPVPLIRVVERALDQTRSKNQHRPKVHACVGKDVTVFADGCALTDMLAHMLKHASLVGGTQAKLRLKARLINQTLSFTVQVRAPFDLNLQDEHFQAAKGLAEWQGGQLHVRQMSGAYFVRASVQSQSGLSVLRNNKEEITQDLLQAFVYRTAQKNRNLSQLA